ncbi:cell wall-active antibiotics response protein LiaF [Pontibacillus litoralis]|uniref:Cell wall-active antibiotics response LiaF-like C-terminal domain-containing protein n=1 Tax=Pontibacillus litoralis JSM 072002 TaxID=1385512 RepID=A0A0A5G0T9_9BACI|nr:cell wall-active antibiotics response protein LiaF [Pontibacillus litoralis]KGX84733.1 hypothetical protein N784_12020 [Pontibacillus litoralis JSM 072002]
MGKIGHYGTGLLIIGLGVFLLLTNFNMISMDVFSIIQYVYPYVFIIIGIFMMVQVLRGRSNKWRWAIFWLIFGGLLVGDRLGYISFQFYDVWNLWPVLFIYIGVSFFLTKKNSDKEYSSISLGDSQSFTIGEHRYEQTNWVVEPMRVNNGIGEYYFDFTKAFIPDTETHIQILGIIGEVTMIIPDHIPFQVQGNVTLGEIRVIEEKASGFNKQIVYQSPDYSVATRKLNIQVGVFLGEFTVDKV